MSWNKRYISVQKYPQEYYIFEHSSGTRKQECIGHPRKVNWIVYMVERLLGSLAIKVDVGSRIEEIILLGCIKKGAYIASSYTKESLTYHTGKYLVTYREEPDDDDLYLDRTGIGHTVTYRD